MRDDHDALIKSGYRLALWLAQRWARSHDDLDLDELVGEALLALTRAASRFDADREGANWPGLVRIAVDHQLGRYVTLHRRRRAEVPWPTVHDADGEGVPLDVPAPEPRPDPLAAVPVGVMPKVLQAIATLPAAQRQLIEARFLSGPRPATFAALGASMGISKQAVSLRLNKAVSTLRARLEPAAGTR